MHIIKLYEVKLNITAEELYQGLLDESFIINKVKRLYEGKCLFSALILKVNRILKQSGFYCSKSRNDGSSDIDVSFEADALVYQNGNIIVGCEIKHIDRSGQIICDAPHAIIQLERDRRIQGLGMGKTIPVIVERASYSIGKSQITVTGVPYFHSFDFILHQVKDLDISKIPADDIMVLRKLEENIQKERDLVKTLDKKQYEYFNNLFYPFKGNPEKLMKEKYHDKIELINLMDSLKLLTEPKKTPTPKNKQKKDESPIFLMRHPILIKSEPLAFSINPSFFRGGAPKVKLLSGDYNITVETSDYVSVMNTMLDDYYNYLKMIRMHVERYSDDVKKNEKVWNLYQRRKK